jgi:hypothetical protein
MIASRLKWLEIRLAEIIFWHETWLQLFLCCVGLAVNSNVVSMKACYKT